MRSTKLIIFPLATIFLLMQSVLAGPAPDPTAKSKPSSSKVKKSAAKPDRSKKVQRGIASYYAPMFNGRKMANGERFKPNSNSAASKTLPLGTKAKVTNLESGKSAVVVIEDRGPYVDGRIIDVTPKTAERLDFKEDGVTPVKVTPLEVPKAEGNSEKSPAADTK